MKAKNTKPHGLTGIINNPNGKPTGIDGARKNYTLNLPIKLMDKVGQLPHNKTATVIAAIKLYLSLSTPKNT